MTCFANKTYSAGGNLMLFRITTIIVFVACSSTTLAEKKQPLDLDDPKPLIMQPAYKLGTEFTEQKNTHLLDTKKNPNGDEITAECNKLKRKYDSLKGKPQRRWAVKERYKAECQAYFDRHR
jgi:hypothetical protein